MQRIFRLSTLAQFILYTFFAPGLQAQQLPVTVKIGQQEWMARNLDVSTFRNGDTIPEAQTDAAWKTAYMEEKPAWCYYGNDPQNGLKYGKLYNWYAVNDARGLAPKGYHVPGKAAWDSLMLFLGGQKIAGKKLKNNGGWPKAGNGTNESGFSALPGSIRYYSGYFDPDRSNGHWWTNTELPPMYVWQYYLMSADDGVGYYSRDYGKGAGMSVRCVRD